MTLSLPPKSSIRCSTETARFVYNQLTSVIAGHPQATTTYRFYEEIDTWLGPWGSAGYPIGYGKFYNIAFTTNEKLMANPVAKEWVWRTSIALQEALRDFVVSRIGNCTISSLTEPMLREAAFASHPRAYDRGGLATVILTAPELVPVIASIPALEFIPGSENFSATWTQVGVTFRLVAPKVAGGALAAAAGPAHTGMLRIAVDRDRRRMTNEMAVGRELGGLKSMIESGKLDHIPWLDQVIARLNATEFPDQGYARFAREVIAAAEVRKRRVHEYYRCLPYQGVEVRQRMQCAYPTAH